MIDRAALHTLVDELPESDLEAIAKLLRAYRQGDRAAVQSLLAEEAAPEDDELALLAEARAENGTPIAGETLRAKYGAASA